ncbi:hypothetical protein FF38_06362 [Lucilia cuprina]|uniref:Uncharacterized protein n=1 Tax=Lucilia cuprina TaxID=7375 RepID=A0A0L0C3F7_LUCCU|nr:neuropeptide-like protein 31 [Lucilia cuprina]KNC26786.1 hypothetical protein FF38_06362 [Lucilia cuprina]
MKYFNVLCIFVIIALFAVNQAAELQDAESSLAAKSPEKRGIYGFGYGHGLGGYGGGYGLGHGLGGYGGHGYGYPSVGYAVHAAPLIGHGHGFGGFGYHGHGFYH